MAISVGSSSGASVDFLTSRREVKKSTLAPMLLLLLAACSKAPPETPAAPPTPRDETPVIIYLIDTLRADRLGLYGYDKPTSPTIDALAKESVVFERAHAAAPWTLPSVASLVTSRYPCEHGIVRTRLKLSPSIPTLAEHLQGLGYSTGAHYQNLFAGQVAGLDRGYQVSEFRYMRDSKLQDLAREFVQKAGNNPFLLYLHSMEPHEIFNTPPEHIMRFGHVSLEDRQRFRAQYDSYHLLKNIDATNERPVGTTDATKDFQKVMGDMTASSDQIRILYDAATSAADTNLKSTIDFLRSAGIWDRAIFVLMADHGEEFGEHGGWFHDQSVYEELLHVPLVVHFPGGRFGGQRIAERVSLLDVMPTVLDYLGHPDLCAGCRGSSLLPLVDAEDQRQYRSPDVVAIRMNAWGYYKPFKETRGDINVVLWDGAFKGIWNLEPDRTEIYDMSQDPDERIDLRTMMPPRANTIGQQARTWLRGCEGSRAEPVPVPREEVTDTMIEQLRAHGYFGG